MSLMSRQNLFRRVRSMVLRFVCVSLTSFSKLRKILWWLVDIDVLNTSVIDSLIIHTDESNETVIDNHGNSAHDMGKNAHGVTNLPADPFINDAKS